MSIEDYCGEIDSKTATEENMQTLAPGIRKLYDGTVEYVGYNGQGKLVRCTIPQCPERIWEAVREIERDRLNGAIS